MAFFLILIILINFRFFTDENQIEINYDNIHQYIDVVPESFLDILKAVELAKLEPSVIFPCRNTTWYIDDFVQIFWQGGARDECGHRGSPGPDGVMYTIVTPSWMVRIELYSNGEFVELLLPLHSDNLPINLDSLHDNRTQSWQHTNLPHWETEIHWETGEYQIRVVCSILPIEHIQADIWSEPFTIEEPRLDIIFPNSSTEWREGFRDIHVIYNNFGSFGLVYPEKIRAPLQLYRYGELLDEISFMAQFSEREFRSNTRVKPEWGSGNGYQVCIEIPFEKRYFSEIFSIRAPDIDVTYSSAHYCDEPLHIEWTPTAARTVCIDLYRKTNAQDELQMILASNIPNTGQYTYEDSLPEDYLSMYRLVITDNEGFYGYSNFFGFYRKPD